MVPPGLTPASWTPSLALLWVFMYGRLPPNPCNKETNHWKLIEDSSQEEPLGFLEEVRFRLGFELEGGVFWDNHVQRTREIQSWASLWIELTGAESCGQRTDANLLRPPDINVWAKLLTHAFTSRSWIRISSGLENLVTRRSHSDPTGPDHQGCSDSLSSGLDSQSSFISYKKEGRVRSIFLLLGRLDCFLSFVFLSSWMLKIATFWVYSKYWGLQGLQRLLLSGEVNLKSASLSRGTYVHVLTPNGTLLGGLWDLSIWHSASL